MIYIDSDGVMANFREWARKHIDETPTKNMHCDKDIKYLMIKYYKTVFYDSNEMFNAKDYFSILKNEKDSYVLTAVPNIDDLIRDFPHVKNIRERVNVMIENKYRWFEERGIPRNKVVIVNGSREKYKFCNKGDILYDDYKKNITKWVESGGIGILVNN